MWLKIIREEKTEYERSLIKCSRNSRKIFYKYISNINRNNSFKKVGPLIDQNWRIVVDDMEMASLLNRYFVLAFRKIDTSGSK